MKFNEIPLCEATTYKGKGVVAVYENYYWIVTKGDMLLQHKNGAPQCNRDKRLVDSLLKAHPHCRIEQIPVVFLEVSDEI